MTDWAKLTSGLEHALTLDEGSAEAFLEATIEGDDTLSVARRLLARSKQAKGFMQTGGLGDSAEEENAATDILPDGTHIGVWELQGLVGQGGMGQVYRARRADGLYEQIVALKVISRDSALGNARFQNERRRLAQLEHPGIARIVDGGVTPDGRGYMAMEFVDGRPIDDHASPAGLSREARLSLFERLCSAVSHAHARLILHRDIKPENVLVDGAGQVRLIDFGIASGFGEEDQQGPALTISSAAPEQLKGEPVSVQTDIFALGVLLHRLLTGTLPQRQADGSMAPDAARLASRDLLAIIGRSLAAAPGERYASVDALRDDILAVLERRPVDARQAGQFYRIGKFFSRYPLASALGGVAIAALVGGLVTSLNFAAEAEAEAERANAALEQVQWQWTRTEATLDAQQAYSDILQRAFGSEADVERLSGLMLERLGEAFDNRDNDPDTAASLSYAVGRNFYFRGDTRRALEVFDPWMSEQFGREPLLDIGREIYALMLVDAGRTEEAEPMLRSLIDAFDNGYRQSKADLFNYAFKLARITNATADIDRAEALVLELIAEDTDPFETLFHYNQLGFLRMAKSDRSGAHAAFTRTVELFDENPNLVAYGRDIARYNLAAQELGFRRDLDRAEFLSTAILQEDVPLKGESLQAGRALLIRGLVQAERGETDASNASLSRAEDLVIQFSGQGTPPHLTTLAGWASTRARAGQPGEARDLLAQARQVVEDPAGNPSLEMIALHIDVAEDVDAAALAPRLSSEAFQQAVERDAVLYYLYQLLVEDGVAPALPAAATD